MNRELELLRKEVAELKKRLSGRENSHGPQTSGSNTSALGTAQQITRPNTVPNRHPTSGTLNYAQVLQSGPSLAQSNSWTKVQSKKTKTKTSSAKAVTMTQRKIIVLRNAQVSKMKTKEDLVAIRDEANKTLLEAGALPHPKIACASVNAKGNLILLTRDDCKASELVNFHEAIKIRILQIDPAIESIQGQQTWLKLAIHGIDQLRFPPTEEGMQALQEEIETYNSEVNLLARPRYYTRAAARSSKRHSSVVIAVGSQETKMRLLHRGLYVATEKCKTSDFISVRPTDTCSKCLGYGHHWTYCKKKQPRCKFCTDEHQSNEHTCSTCTTRGKQCQHMAIECFRCGGAHLATSPVCEVNKKLIQNLRNGTNEDEELTDDNDTIVVRMEGTSSSQPVATGTTQPTNDSSMDTSQ
ncbi:hypothetical protein EX30DRAFT_365763 [Ascodesmis nigricans]|uniref:CCHC-type domain-containing protein n=1 Tax=Ascodesmis nigricans TaxID=341454 RepID=A0A4S2MNM9_9PEZI|nr:hypothetical protein EX30DRAFT_365763 [Ascodesmis nigricans]